MAKISGNDEESRERNVNDQMHAEDKARMHNGRKYGREHQTEFAHDHPDELAALIGTYSDETARALLDDLRERFWGRDWEPREVRDVKAGAKAART